MREIGAFEAKNKFDQLLDWVERGEEITITRHGKEVAATCLVHLIKSPIEPVLWIIWNSSFIHHSLYFPPEFINQLQSCRELVRSADIVFVAMPMIVRSRCLHIHLVTLLPGHFALLAKARIV